MEVEMYPWRRDHEIGEALAVAAPVLVSLGVAEPGGGYSAMEIAAAEQRLGRPVPGDVREFYRAVKPTKMFDADDRKEFGFYRLDAPELAWRSMEQADPADDWKGAIGLALGQSTYGDPFWWVEGHRTIPDGAIVLLDHEGTISEDVMFAYFARSFREFIGKVAYFRSLFAKGQDPLFRQEYAELNPVATQ